jgi:tetratricopeptide (TPR) repeat protein
LKLLLLCQTQQFSIAQAPQLRIGCRVNRVIEQCNNALEFNPHISLAYIWLGYVCIRLGKPDEGIGAIETAVQNLGYAPLYLGVLGAAYSQTGRIGDAQRILKQLREIAQTTYVPAIAFAMICHALGEMNEGFDWLEKAVEEQRLFHIIHFNVLNDSLLSHPRYRALLRKMNLEP